MLNPRQNRPERRVAGFHGSGKGVVASGCFRAAVGPVKARGFREGYEDAGERYEGAAQTFVC